MSKTVEKRNKIKKKSKKSLQDYLGTTQMWVHTKFEKDLSKVLAYRKIINLTLDRQTPDTKFLLQLLSPRGPNCAEKSFSSIRRKRICETIAINVLQDSGHIETT